MMTEEERRQVDELERRVVDAIAALEAVCRDGDDMPFAVAVQTRGGYVHTVNPDGTSTRTGSCWSSWQMKTNMDADALGHLEGAWRVHLEHEKKREQK